jgi:hypothetical protein
MGAGDPEAAGPGPLGGTDGEATTSAPSGEGEAPTAQEAPSRTARIETAAGTIRRIRAAYTTPIDLSTLGAQQAHRRLGEVADSRP